MAGRAEQEHVMRVVVLHLDGEVSSVFVRNNILPRKDKTDSSLHLSGPAAPQFLFFLPQKGLTKTKSPGKQILPGHVVQKVIIFILLFCSSLSRFSAFLFFPFQKFITFN